MRCLHSLIDYSRPRFSVRFPDVRVEGADEKVFPPEMIISVAAGEKLPVRTGLAPARSINASELELFRALAESPDRASDEMIAQAIESRYEALMLLAIRSIRLVKKLPQDARSKKVLVDRLAEVASVEAKKEGVLWTPVLDTLAEHEAGLAGPQGKELGEIAPIRAHLRELIPYLCGIESSESLEECFQFRSQHLYLLIARQAGSLSDEQMRHLLKYDAERAMLRNPRLQEEQRVWLLRNAWKRWCEAEPVRSKKGMLVDRSRGRDAFMQALHKRPEGLPEEVGEEMLSSWEAGVARKDEDESEVWSWRLLPLLTDPGLNESHLERLFAYEGVNVMAGIISHPAATAKQIRRALRSAEGDRAAVAAIEGRTGSQGWMSTSRLEIIMEEKGSVSDVLCAALWHRSSTPKMWHDALEVSRGVARGNDLASIFGGGRVLIALAQNPEAREDPLVFQRLMDNGAPSLLREMFPLKNPRFYTEAWTRIWNEEPNLAKNVLLDNPPPEGTVLPAPAMVQILSEASAEERLQLIVIAGRLSTAAEGKREEEREEGRATRSR